MTHRTEKVLTNRIVEPGEEFPVPAIRCLGAMKSVSDLINGRPGAPPPGRSTAFQRPISGTGLLGAVLGTAIVLALCGGTRRLEAQAPQVQVEDEVRAALPSGKPNLDAPQNPDAAPGANSLWNVISKGVGGSGAQSGMGAGPPEAGANEEMQKKVNEHVRLAHQNMEKGRVSEALKNVNELVSLRPYESEYHLALGLCFRREGKYAEAQKKYQDALDLGGPKALVALLKAEAAAAEGKHEKVFELLKEAAIGGRNIINDVRLLPLLSVFQNDSEFVKLALQLEHVTVTSTRSFDPFTNPFPRSDLKGDKGGQNIAETVTALAPEEQEKLLQEARKTLERVLFYIKLDDDNKAMKAYGSLKEMIRKKEMITVPRIINDFKSLASRLESLEVEIQGIRLKYYYNLAQSKLKQMKDSFMDGEYEKVEGTHGEVIKLTQEMEATNANYKPVAEQIVSASSKWVARARVRQDFESRKPSIQGIVISDDAKVALLNDRFVKQGEYLDDVRIVKVESNKVTFRYKGEEIPLIFRRY